MHDGSKLFLKKLEQDYVPTDKIAALRTLHEAAPRGEFATGLIYIEPDRDDFLTLVNIVDEPLATLPLERVRPGREALEEIMESLRYLQIVIGGYPLALLPLHSGRTS